MLSQKPRILVLEDDEHFRITLERVLTRQGYEVAAVDRGLAAVQLACEQPFDLIVADIRMEGMDGLEAVRQTQMRQPEIGSLIVSGYATPEETGRASEMKVGGFLKKPFKMKEFLQSVSQILAQRGHQVQASERRQQANDVLGWALDCICELSGVDRYRRLQSVVEGLGRQLKWSSSLSQAVSRAALLSALRLYQGLELPPWLAADPCPHPEVATILRRLEQSESLEGQVARVALAVVDDHEAEGFLPPWEELLLEEMSEEVVVAYHRLRGSGWPRNAGFSPASTSLLALARALEQSGDLEAAAQAYCRLEESVEACLGRGRVALRQGDLQAGREAISAVEPQLDRLGPVELPIARLEWALLLRNLGGEEKAQSGLRRAWQEAEAVGQPSVAAQAMLALSRDLELSPEQARICALEISRPENLWQLSGQEGWLLPGLLRLSDRHRCPETLHALSFWTVNASPELAKLLEKGLIGLPERAILLDLLEQSGFLPDEIYQSLLRDSDADLAARAAQLDRGVVEQTPVIRIFSFGVFRVLAGSKRIEPNRWRSKKIRYLFAYLSAPWGQRHDFDSLAELFWPHLERKGRSSLHTGCSVIRKIFRDEVGNELLVRDGESLVLNDSVQVWHDARELEEAYLSGIQAERQQQLDQAVVHFQRVVQLSQDEYMKGCFMDWALKQRAVLEGKVVDALTRLTQIHLQRQDFEAGLASSQRLLQIQPLRQDGHLWKIESLTGLGRNADAVQQFQRIERRLKTELDLEPKTELLRAYHVARLGL